jgi:hypothetical protein
MSEREKHSIAPEKEISGKIVSIVSMSLNNCNFEKGVHNGVNF